MSERKPLSPKVRWQIFARDGFRCRYCGAEGGAAVLVVDHVVPVARGGRDDLANLLTACETCNAGKSDSAPPSYSEMRVYNEVAARAMQWLVDVWCEITGDAVDWMPNPAIYMNVLRYAATYGDAEGVIRVYAEAASGGEPAESVLTRLWDDMHFDDVLRTGV